MILEERIRLLKSACGIAMAEDRIGGMMRDAIGAADRGEGDKAMSEAKAIWIWHGHGVATGTMTPPGNLLLS